MLKRLNGRLGILFVLSLVLVVCAFVLFPVNAKAEGREFPKSPKNRTRFDYDIVSGSEIRKYGTTYNATLNADSMDAFCCEHYNENGRYHYSFKIETQNYELDEIFMYTPAYNPDEREIWLYKDSFKCKYDKTSKTYTYTCNVTCEAEDLWCMVYNYSNKAIKYKVTIDAEPEIVLSKTTISEITNTRSHTMTVKYAPVKNRLGYQIEYADNSKFNNKTRVNTGATTKDIGKLTIGKYYYVRVRAYARYSNGDLVYSKWSGTRKIKIKK